MSVLLTALGLACLYFGAVLARATAGWAGMTDGELDNWLINQPGDRR